MQLRVSGATVPSSRAAAPSRPEGHVRGADQRQAERDRHIPNTSTGENLVVNGLDWIVISAATSSPTRSTSAAGASVGAQKKGLDVRIVRPTLMAASTCAT
jgi:hypothetical protein